MVYEYHMDIVHWFLSSEKAQKEEQHIFLLKSMKLDFHESGNMPKSKQSTSKN